MDVDEWLHSLHLRQYAQNFKKNGVDVDLLPHLTAKDLEDIGVSTVGDRRRLIVAIARLRGANPIWSIPTPKLMIYAVCYLDLLSIIFGSACAGWFHLHPAGRLGPVSPAVDAAMQIDERTQGLAIFLILVCFMFLLSCYLAFRAGARFPNIRSNERNVKRPPDYRKAGPIKKILEIVLNLKIVIYIVCCLNVVFVIFGSAYVGWSAAGDWFAGAELSLSERFSLSLVLVLGACFTFGISWAFALYTVLRGDEPLDEPLGHEWELHFHNLARQHKQWAQLWFTISVCVLIAGVMLLVLMMQRNETADNKLVSQILLEFLGFSLILVVWNWSVQHFRAHWHNFIELAYRSRSLDVLKLMADEGGPERPEIRKTAAELLARYGATAYLEREHPTTLAEKIDQIKHKLAELITGWRN